MGQVRLNNVCSTQSEEVFEIEAGVQTLARGDGNVGIASQLRHGFKLLAQHGFFDKQRSVRFNGFDQHFSHRGVDSTVKVNGNVQLVAYRVAQAGNALDCGVDFAQMIYHLKLFCEVHLGGAKTVANGLLCRLHNVSGTIAANPGIDLDSITDLSA